MYVSVPAPPQAADSACHCGAPSPTRACDPHTSFYVCSLATDPVRPRARPEMHMTISASRSGLRALWVRRAAALLSLAAVTVVSQPSGYAQADPPDALPFAKGYTVTGNYVVSGVDLPASGVGGYVTGTINMNGVPADAEILAAFLYWETISTVTGAVLDYE